ncbi:hypothetical protein MtrunA17_Chr4g0070861 [Medicago truncatula]|uniref:Transmembrane protein n=1 Tax=Medicago truncatula TaxID=3880 RepID=A0A396IL68_MEDTR|nr:hypothetical protein MtrunA17_Chr4g0070861 [Medicago truncatula]
MFILWVVLNLELFTVQCTLLVSKLNNYHAEINEQNSEENCSDGALGGGLSTIVSISSNILSHLSL